MLLPSILLTAQAIEPSAQSALANAAEGAKPATIDDVTVDPPGTVRDIDPKAIFPCSTVPADRLASLT
jgi:hypothetical protein